VRLEGLETFFRNLPDYVRDVLYKTRITCAMESLNNYFSLRAFINAQSDQKDEEPSASGG